MVDIPGDPDGRKLHVEYLSVRDSYDLAGKKRKDPDNPKGKRGGLVRREYRLVSRDYGISPRPLPHQAIVAPTHPARAWFKAPAHPSVPIELHAPSHAEFSEVTHEFDH